MSLEYFQLQIESEREWREEELRFLDNTQRTIENDSDRKKFGAQYSVLYMHILKDLFSFHSLYMLMK